MFPSEDIFGRKLSKKTVKMFKNEKKAVFFV
jgi:hypothetical protein